MIGIPVGPPRVVGVAEPAPVVAQPSPPPDLSRIVRREVQDWLEANRDQLRGDPGPAGQDGKPGNPGRAIDKAMAEDIITSWLDANADQLKGEPGAPGRDGVDGKPGERGLIGVPSEAEIAAVIDMWIQRNDPRIKEFVRKIIREEKAAEGSSDVEARLTAVEQRRLRMMIVDGASNKILDDETYEPEDPVVLDIRRLRNRSDAE